MDENNAWNRFEQSGKISDYLKYTQLKTDSAILSTVSKVGENAAQDTRYNPQTT